jgi:N-acetylglucosaminyl-diphospho-decaprenol L-rhamnosyltransferase
LALTYFLTVNFYSSQWIAKLWDSIAVQSGDESILVVVNNAIDDMAIATWIETEIEKINKGEKIQLISAPKNLGFGKACNLGLNWIRDRDKQALVWLINPDARLSEKSLVQVQHIFQTNPAISILGTTIKSESSQNNPESILFAGGSFNPDNGEIKELIESSSSNDIDNQDLRETRDLRETKWLSGCSLILNLANFTECPFFSEDYFLYYEDFDFCQRYARTGHKIWFSDRIFVYHQVSAIAKKYPITKVRHEIYGYLISLKKYCSQSVLNQRLRRILFAAIWQFPRHPQRSLGKFQGLYQFWQKTKQSYK